MGAIHLLNGAAKLFFVSSVLAPAECKRGSALLNREAKQRGDRDEAYVFSDTFGACSFKAGARPEQYVVQSVLPGVACGHAISGTSSNRHERGAKKLVGKRRAEKISRIVFGRFGEHRRQAAISGDFVSIGIDRWVRVGARRSVWAIGQRARGYRSERLDLRTSIRYGVDFRVERFLRRRPRSATRAYGCGRSHLGMVLAEWHEGAESRREIPLARTAVLRCRQ
jgi:hypothetical protein